MALILVWGLLPLLLQIGFGADILLQNWRILLPAISLPTVYLWIVDALAIGSGTWTIDPQQTTGLLLGNLPFEEMLFFFITNLMVGFGIVLMASPDSQRRAAALLYKTRAKFRPNSIAKMDLGKEIE
jgi:putative membrane protein